MATPSDSPPLETSNQPPIESTGQPPKKKGGWPKGKPRTKKAAAPVDPHAAPQEQTPQTLATAPPKEDKAARAARWATQREQIDECAPIHLQFHSAMTVPVIARAMAARGIDLATIEVDAVKSDPRNPHGMTTVKLRGTDALALACAELTALYVPMDAVAHPAMPALLTVSALAMALAQQKFAHLSKQRAAAVAEREAAERAVEDATDKAVAEDMKAMEASGPQPSNNWGTPADDSR